MKHKKSPSKLIITIDGPAASGKGTAAYLLAREYGLLNLDSGACYRAVAWLAIEHNVPIDEQHATQLGNLLERYPLQLIPNVEKEGPKCLVKVGDKDITDLIRTSEVGDGASVVGSIQLIRELVREHEHRIARASDRGIIAEGRDTGTVVFPEADIKFFLTAAEELRAERRHGEYVVAGKDIAYEEVLAEIEMRDERDTVRAYSPLRIPVDALVVDSTGLEIEQTVAIMKGHIDKVLRGRE